VTSRNSSPKWRYMLHFHRKEGDGSFAAAHSLPYLPLSFHGSSMAHNITVMFQAFPPQNSVALTQAVCGGLTVELKVTLEHFETVWEEVFGFGEWIVE
jgi:E3 ubiquitin-protein ligase HUWE1